MARIPYFTNFLPYLQAVYQLLLYLAKHLAFIICLWKQIRYTNKYVDSNSENPCRSHASGLLPYIIISYYEGLHY